MSSRSAPKTVLLSAASALVLGGCLTPPVVPRYVEPPPEALHAVVLLSSKHSRMRGPNLDHVVDVDGRQLVVTDGWLAQSTRAIRVTPGSTRWTAASRFYHFEQTMHLEPVARSESRYDSCASKDSRGHCKGEYRSVTTSSLEWVTKRTVVNDAHCEAASGFMLEGARSYRVLYTFDGPNACTLTCHDITEGENGTACIPVAATPGQTPTHT